MENTGGWKLKKKGSSAQGDDPLTTLNNNSTPTKEESIFEDTKDEKPIPPTNKNENLDRNQMGNKWLLGRTQYIFSYALENWYKNLKEVTFKSTIIPLDRMIISEMIEHHFTQISNLKVAEKDQTDELLYQSKTLQRFASSLDILIQKKYDGNVFCKLSTRSPKDALTSKRNFRMESALMQELAKLRDYSENSAHIAFLTATRKGQLCRSGRDVLDLMMKSSRVYEDLKRATEFEEQGIKLNLILREWFEIHPGLEFRCFVSKGEMTAITQYCYFAHFPQILDLQNDFVELLQTFWKEEIKDPLKNSGFENYVVDFALTEDQRVFLVELNPFFGDTGGCLFDWHDSKDVQILKNGPFEARFLQDVKKRPLDVFSSEWKAYLQKHLQAQQFMKKINCGVALVSIVFVIGFIVWLLTLESVPRKTL